MQRLNELFKLTTKTLFYRKLLPFLWLLPTLACSLLAAPPRPTIPTPPPTAGAAINFEDLVVNPVGDVSTAVDPNIQALVNAVSRQNLFAYVQTLTGFGTRHSLSDPQRPDYGIGAARVWIYNELQNVGGGRLDVRFDDFPMTYNGLVSNQQNIVATLRGAGSYPGVIVLGAHYDSRSVDVSDGSSLAPGANDDASGVALLIEVARLMSSRTWNQTVVFVAFAAEEQGTYGSFHFVQEMMLDNLLMDVMITNDIVGGHPGIPSAIRVFAAGNDLSPSSDTARYMQYVSGLYLPDFPVEYNQSLDREGRYSDHREFVNVGVGAVRVTESVEDYSVQHTAADTADRLDYDYLTKVAQFNLAAITSMAGAPPRPPAPVVTAMADPGSFILAWATEPTAVGYALSFRPVGTSQYPILRFLNREDAGNVAITGLDPSVTYAISLAALDASGRLSLFSYPEVIVGP